MRRALASAAILSGAVPPVVPVATVAPVYPMAAPVYPMGAPVCPPPVYGAPVVAPPMYPMGAPMYGSGPMGIADPSPMVYY